MGMIGTASNSISSIYRQKAPIRPSQTMGGTVNITGGMPPQQQMGSLGSPQGGGQSTPSGPGTLQGAGAQQVGAYAANGADGQSAGNYGRGMAASNYMQPNDQGVYAGGPAQAAPGGGGPSLSDIQAEQQRQQVGAQLNSNPQNSALSGYMMG